MSDTRGYIRLPSPAHILSAASAGGKHEENGPLGGGFDVTDAAGSDKFGKSTWEDAESEMQRLTLGAAMRKIGKTDADIDAVFAGDLQNQCVGSNYGLLDFDIPYFGLYGACSTSAEALILGSIFVTLQAPEHTGIAAAVASSHNSAAERQFRNPIEYGGQHAPTSQWTVTGAGAFILGHDGDGNLPAISDVLIGRSVDLGINDLNNMGAAMAPAALDTLERYFEATGSRPENYDLILTGDLGREGSAILSDFMSADGYEIGGNYSDCGLMIYDIDGTDKHAGGSGCGCSAAALAAGILPRMMSGELKNVLFMATGALMSPASVWQGKNIPGICHLVHIQKQE
ncbi:MAG: stage V sporulation protein AD [Firmicutes bacterium]|nr:stage V sporulation protein AD [Bacillota bacterium]